MADTNALDVLIQSLKRLPGVGVKSASRMAFHLLQHDRAGAQALSEALGRAVSSVRQDFRVLAFWIGSVTTDARGHATVDVKLPESLTTYRIMAVAGDRSSRFSSADAEIRINKPVTLKATFPRFPTDKNSVERREQKCDSVRKREPQNPLENRGIKIRFHAHEPAREDPRAFLPSNSRCVPLPLGGWQ